MNKLLNSFNIDEKIKDIVFEEEQNLLPIFQKYEQIELNNSIKVLKTFKEENVMESDFNSTSGYGYNDLGRDKIERIFAKVLGSEDALVRNQFISGTHALTVCLFALLRPNDTLLSITGTPYDTLHEVIGIKENPSSLKSYGINYEQIDLIDNDFNYELIKNILIAKKIKVIEIQRSKGYSTRKSITIDKLKKVIDFIKKIDNDVIIMVDNCYCEFVEELTPCEVGADIMVGSLIKNLGGGIARNGAYIAGGKNLIELCAERLTVPGEGKEVGPSLGANREFLLGLYHAPYAVLSSIKLAILTSKVMARLGYLVEPTYDEARADIVQNIIFNDKEKLITYCRGIQESSAIDANALLMPSDMPGYSDKIIMASGSFTQGSSIEISCDGPLRDPFIAYQQGSLSYSYGKISLMVAVSKLLNNK